MENSNEKTSLIKSVLVTLLLILVFPVGLIAMWRTTWNKYIKLGVTLFFALLVLGVALVDGNESSQHNSSDTGLISESNTPEPQVNNDKSQSYLVHKRENITDQTNLSIIVAAEMTKEQIDQLLPEIISNECEKSTCAVSVYDSNDAARLASDRAEFAGDIVAWDAQHMSTLEEHWLAFFIVSEGEVQDDWGYKPQKAR
jgi:hypothetical protein